MSELIFYTNPQSRGRTVRWMLEEVGTPYETVLLDYGTSMKSKSYRAINPMGKVPAILHRGRVVTEGAAICAYLADAFPEAGLAPPPAERAAYYRWLFFGAGPVEAAVMDHYRKIVPEGQERVMVGYGSWEDVLNMLEFAVSQTEWIAGDRFSAADVYAGAQIDWPLQFGMIKDRPKLAAYADRLRARPAYARAKATDEALIAEAARAAETA
jgi:glutathione S-transferase